MRKKRQVMTERDENNAWIKVIHPVLDPPSLQDNTADVDRFIKGIKKALQTEEVSIDLSLVKKIPTFLREHGYDVFSILYRESNTWHVVDCIPPRMDTTIYGLSVDLGSSSVVVRLLDIVNREIRDETSFLNPQNEIGPDILTRIHFASQKGGLARLQSLVINRLNKEISELAKKHRIDTDSLVAMSVAGNTTMTHLFLGLDPFWICREPYIPVINSPDLLKSKELGLHINPNSPIMVLPCVGSYLGGDLIAGILASGMGHREEVSILVDVGTNAEVVLGNNEWLVACAGAAGPALEGGVAGMGMMAGPGVIDKVTIDPRSGKFSVRTIEDRPPAGICGSGLIDLVAQLFLAGMIDLRGKFVKSECADRLKEIDGIRHLVVVFAQESATGKDLTLSQTDIDSLLRSKAAMHTILVTITTMINFSMEQIKDFFIAGTFGLYIDPRSAITIGMIPDLPLETYKPLGNTCLAGATRVLLSATDRDEVYRIRDRITYIELNVNQEFMNRFSAAKFIPHTDSSLFPSVEKLKSDQGSSRY
jgi:uncharacterized 2Fe-2S/4Fe-4S cluster protein (DUF4445 family)